MTLQQVTEEGVWLSAFNAALPGAITALGYEGTTYAGKIADDALLEFGKRFPQYAQQNEADLLDGAKLSAGEVDTELAARDGLGGHTNPAGERYL